MIGPYSVERELGRGGMGVVFLAVDPRLDRRVAIKALPEHLAADPERLARFEREAKTLASLSHANVAGIYGVEEHAGHRYLVLEYVEGETLAERLDRGAMPIDEALEIADQVAAGVEAAHDAGVIHRDLKPGNVIVTPDGRAKVLDFGLARSEESTSASGSSMSPTLTSPAGSQTVPGVIMGTAAYMSPEQARGRRVDRRADIWSFGVMLYEMLTGASPFVGETVSDSIGAILHKDIDLDRLPPGTPRQVRHVLGRCLERDKSRRYRDIGDARLDLRMRTPSVDAQAGAPTRLHPALLLLIALAMAVVGAGAWLAGGAMRPPAPEAAGAMHMAIPMRVPENPAGRTSSEFSVAPATGQLVFIAEGGTPGESNLYVRSFDEPEARRIPGTERASQLSVSPDGRTVVFMWNDPDNPRGELRRVSIDGGPVTTLLASDRGAGFRLDVKPIWLSPTSVLLNSTDRLVLSELSLESLEMRPLVHVPEIVEAAAFVVPWSVISGTRIALASIGVPDPVRGPVIDLYAIDLGAKTAKRVLTGVTRTVVFDSGRRIAFIRNGALCVARFDLEALALVGEFTPMYAPVSHFDITPRGDLFYAIGSGAATGVRPMLVGLDGAREPLVDRRMFLYPLVHVSPDGGRIGLTTVPEPGGPPVAQVLDIATGFVSPVVPGNLVTAAPVWIDDDDLVYQRYLSAARIELHRIRPGLESEGAPLIPRAGDGGVQLLPEFSPDSRWVAYQSSSSQDASVRDIWLAPLGREGDARPIVQSGRVDTLPAFSPDGRWLAYCSNSAGEFRVVMQAFDTETGALSARIVPVSQGQGTNPVWSADGAWLYFIDTEEQRLMRVAVEQAPALRLAPPEVVLTSAQLDGLRTAEPRAFDIFPDGERFVFVEQTEQDDRDQPYINVALNWLTELRSRMPAD